MYASQLAFIDLLTDAHAPLNVALMESVLYWTFRAFGAEMMLQRLGVWNVKELKKE